MFGLIYRISRWFLNKPVQLGAGLAQRFLASADPGIIITSKSQIPFIEKIANPNLQIAIVDPPLEVSDLDALLPKISAKNIIGIGGGVIMDTAKYFALKTKARLTLIPSILSTTSWLNMAIAIRKDRNLYFPGTFHAQQIIVDPDFISQAPPALSLGGVTDLLCAVSALGDWEMECRLKNKHIPPQSLTAFRNFVNTTIEHPESLVPFTAKSVERIYALFLDALALCGAAFSGRPLEGSEHFMYYYLDYHFEKRWIHGQIIALTALISLKMQGDRALFDWEKIRNYYQAIGLEYSPKKQGLTGADLVQAIENMPQFVVERRLPYSVWNLSPQFQSNTEKEQMQSWIDSL
jgi:glycerol-1-phosphate dehydrogenase [NAD(P)+]